MMTEKEMKIFKLIHESEMSKIKHRSKLENISLHEMINYWKEHEHHNTEYQKIIDELLKANIIPLKFADNEPFTIGGLRYLKHGEIFDRVKARSDWSNDKKKQIITCYKSFIKWLNVISFSWFDRYLASYQIPSHTKKETFAFSDWRLFIDTLHERNKRDELIARTLLQGQKRVSDVLSLKLSQIDFENNTIHYESRGKNEIVRYEKTFMKELKIYIEETKKLRKDKQFVFVTRTGNPLTRSRLNFAFAKTCEAIGIEKIRPDDLRKIYKAFVEQRYSETAIMYSRRCGLLLLCMAYLHSYNLQFH